MDIRNVDNATVICCAVRQIQQAVVLLDSLNIRESELTDIEFTAFRDNIRHIESFNRSLETAREWIISRK